MIDFIIVLAFCGAIVLAIALDEIEEQKQYKKKFNYIVKSIFDDLCKWSEVPNFMNKFAYIQAQNYTKKIAKLGKVEELYKRLKVENVANVSN